MTWSLSTVAHASSQQSEHKSKGEEGGVFSVFGNGSFLSSYPFLQHFFYLFISFCFFDEGEEEEEGKNQTNLECWIYFSMNLWLFEFLFVSLRRERESHTLDPSLPLFFNLFFFCNHSLTYVDAFDFDSLKKNYVLFFFHFTLFCLVL